MIETKVSYKTFATEAHASQKYGDKPYTVHLEAVEKVLEDFGYTSDLWKAVAWLHDVLEDTPTDRGDFLGMFGLDVYDLVMAVSGFGKNRKEKQQNILNKLYWNSDACILKCADRIANCEAGKAEGNTSKLQMYRDEQEAFEEVVKASVPEAMWKRLEDALA